MTEVLQKGANIFLSQAAENLNKVTVIVKWKIKSYANTEFEIDPGAFMLTTENKVRNDGDFIFYNQPESPDKVLTLKTNIFQVELDHIPEKIVKISFTLSIYDAKQRRQHFRMLENISIELFNNANKKKLVTFCLDDTNFETAIILGQLYRYHDQWKFKAIGQGYIDGLDVLAKNFGVDIEDFAEEQQNQIEINNSEPRRQPPNSDARKPQTEQDNLPLQLSNNQREDDLEIHNTDVMTTQAYYSPILKWFNQKNIKAQINPAAVDTTGFFDEIAVALGDNYDLLKVVSNAIKRRQQAGRNKTYLDLSENSSQEIGIVKEFCKLLYEHSFVAKYFYNQKEKKIVLHLQDATKIVNFFRGEWLEWYAFIKTALFCYQNKISFSCARNIGIHLSNDDKYELDVFFLIKGLPFFIECKSGEYRGFISKYSKLRKKLDIKKPYFLFLITGKDESHLKGLSVMYDITFINEKTFTSYIKDVLLDK